MLDMGLLTHEQVEAGRAEAEMAGEGVLDTMVKGGSLEPAIVVMAKSTYFGVESTHLADLRLSDEVIGLVPRHVAKKFNALPVGQSDSGAVVVALADPSDIDTVDGLRHALNKDIELRVTSQADIEAALNKYYGGAGRDDGGISKMIQDITEGEVEITGMKGDVTADGEELDADAPIIKLVNQLIADAFKKRASDLHLEPLAKRFRLRFRIDGVCVEQPDLPKRLQPSIIARLKIQAGMSIAERRIPQDGRINVPVGNNKTIDLRVNCLPTQHGESIVMRILDKSGLKLGLGELGFFADDQQNFERVIGLPDGILLVTGPTGSGKTTTLYSCLNYINRPDRKIITVEDPVEYMLAGINQVQVHEHIGFTFALALRSMLRQAPNVIMLGEIRDMETASIAINASLTGHLVFSTLHTNDAPGAVTRLIDIGVKPFLVASSARCLMAQRLVRKICKNCVAPHTLTEAEMHMLDLTPEQASQATARKGKGCNECNKTGHRGRFGIFEIFNINDEARKLIFEKVPANQLRIKAREMGMRTLREDGIRKVLAGMTTAEEVVRATVTDH